MFDSEPVAGDGAVWLPDSPVIVSTVPKRPPKFQIQIIPAFRSGLMLRRYVPSTGWRVAEVVYLDFDERGRHRMSLICRRTAGRPPVVTLDLKPEDRKRIPIMRDSGRLIIKTATAPDGGRIVRLRPKEGFRIDEVLEADYDPITRRAAFAITTVPLRTWPPGDGDPEPMPEELEAA